MTLNTTRIIATMVALSLFVAHAAAADDKDTAAKSTTVTATTTAELHRKLAASANTAAVEQAVEALLAENKLDLDIRLIGRTSVKIVDGR